MLAPYLFLMVLCGLVPLVLVFNETRGRSMGNPRGGFHSFSVVFHHFLIHAAFVNTVRLVFIFVPAMMLFALLFALLLDFNDKPWRQFLRATYMIPATITGGVALLLWYAMLEPSLSPFRWVMQQFGVTESTQIWRQQNVSLMIGLMVFVGGVGSWIIIQYGSLKSISHEILEAARIDGATSTQIALRIKLPLIKKYIAYMGIVLFGSTLQIFTEPDLLNSTIYQGIASSWSLNQISYALAFDSGEFPLASALSILMIVPTIIIAVIVIVKNDFLNEQG